MTTQTTTVVLCGVGGQGTILAADLLARAVLANGQDVKVSEIHGMSQRGGSVTTVVRYGTDVQSMVGDLGTADVVVSFETTEALRNLPFMRIGGSMIVNDESIEPLPVLSGRAKMPEGARESLLATGALLVPAADIAREAGNPKTSNVALIGALSARLSIAPEVWEEVISKRVPPKTIDANITAFRAGRNYILQKAGE